MQTPDHTHDRRLPSVQTLQRTDGSIETEVPSFNCPHWPECDCPGGTTRPECPSYQSNIEDDGFITVYPLLRESA